jgi:hypothetical protein
LPNAVVAASTPVSCASIACAAASEDRLRRLRRWSDNRRVVVVTWLLETEACGRTPAAGRVGSPTQEDQRSPGLSGPGDADGIGVMSILSRVPQAQRGSGEKP